MTEDDVRAAAERLVQFHERFAPLFGREQAQDHAYTYVKGLMVCPERKSIEPIALTVGSTSGCSRSSRARAARRPPAASRSNSTARKSRSQHGR